MEFAQIVLGSPGHDEEHNTTWAGLMGDFKLRMDRLACAEFMAGFHRLQFKVREAETISGLSAKLQSVCGWTLHPVDGLLPNDQFFQLLGEKVFPVATQLRQPDEVQFSELPDLFHDALGHLPLLLHPVYSDFLVNYANIAGDYIDSPEALECLTRIYWYVIETGIVREAGQEKLLGAAVMTSEAECDNATFELTPKQPFEFEAVFSSDFDPRKLQSRYFILESFASLSEVSARMRPALQAHLQRGSVPVAA